MDTHIIQYSIRINANPRHLYDHLLDPHHLMGLQPFLVAVKDVQDTGVHTIFKGVERLTMFGVPFSNGIRVVQRNAPTESTIYSEVNGILGLRIESFIRFEVDGEGTLCSDQMTIHSPRLFTEYIVKRAKTAQHERLARLKVRAEQGCLETPEQAKV
jgi:hypothetical protein